MANNIRIGISGWTYRPWRGAFYPDGLRQADELAYAARALRTIEINGTFYSLQKPASFEKWHDMTPNDFVFAVKAPRFITHVRRLRDVEMPIANFFASGLLRLGEKLGPILWQFPPRMIFDFDLFEAFLAILPHDTMQAKALAARHDEVVAGRVWLEDTGRRPIRHAVEIRNETFRDTRFLHLLRKYKVALVCADTAEWPYLMDVTADFIYCRLHGSEKIHANGYGETALKLWRTRLTKWAEGGEPADAIRIGDAAKPAPQRDVFVYFDNDLKVRAPRDAMSLARKFGFDGIGSMEQENKLQRSRG